MATRASLIRRALMAAAKKKKKNTFAFAPFDSYRKSARASERLWLEAKVLSSASYNPPSLIVELPFSPFSPRDQETSTRPCPLAFPADVSEGIPRQILADVVHLDRRKNDI